MGKKFKHGKVRISLANQKQEVVEEKFNPANHFVLDDVSEPELQESQVVASAPESTVDLETSDDTFVEEFAQAVLDSDASLDAELENEELEISDEDDSDFEPVEPESVDDAYAHTAELDEAWDSGQLGTEEEFAVAVPAEESAVIMQQIAESLDITAEAVSVNSTHGTIIEDRRVSVDTVVLLKTTVYDQKQLLINTLIDFVITCKRDDMPAQLALHAEFLKLRMPVVEYGQYAEIHSIEESQFDFINLTKLTAYCMGQSPFVTVMLAQQRATDMYNFIKTLS